MKYIYCAILWLKKVNQELIHHVLFFLKPTPMRAPRAKRVVALELAFLNAPFKLFYNTQGCPVASGVKNSGTPLTAQHGRYASDNAVH